MTICISGCANKHSELTYDDAKKVLIPQKTTKDDVKKIFGEPDRTYQKGANELWSYDLNKKTFMQSMATSSAASALASGVGSGINAFIPYGSSTLGMRVGSELSSTTGSALQGAALDVQKEKQKNLTIYFKNNLVERFDLSVY